MEILEPELQKVEVTSYSFIYANGKTLEVDVWHSLNDTMTKTAEGWTFESPRLKKTQEILKRLILSVDITKCERLHPDEMKKILEKAIAKRALAKETAKAKKTGANGENKIH